MTTGTALSLQDLAEARGTPVYSSDGEKIGSVEEIFLDDQTRKPEWIGIGTGFFKTKRVLVPTAGARLEADGFFVPYTKDQVKDTPDIDSDHIDQSTEAALYRHYGLEYSESRSDTGLPEGSPSAKTTDKTSVARSEEELQVGKQPVQAGSVRLRKWVETEPIQTDVEVRQEVARVEREPINQPASSGDIGEQEVEVPLHTEQPVVSKQTVAKEKVSLQKDVESDTQTVADQVRKERVEVEGEGVTTR